MGGPDGRAFKLRPNHGTFTPAVVIVLDSETIEMERGNDTVDVLKCWAARMTYRRHKERAGEVTECEGLDRESCADAIDRLASGPKTVWLYAHNIGFDLVTTRLPALLVERGWSLLARHSVGIATPFITMGKGKSTRTRTDRNGATRDVVDWLHTLTITDSFSVFPVPLQTLAEAAGTPKPALPDKADDDAVWLARCRADVNILSASLLTMMDWHDANDMGRWQVTGAATAWNTYRHTIDEGAVVISHAQNEQPAVQLEHDACYGGRRDVFRCRQLAKGKYAELDFKQAYVTIAATQPLPRKRMGRLEPAITQRILARESRYDMVATVELETDEPWYPARTEHGVFYGTGRFTTVLAGPEIREAQRRGHLVRVVDGWYYSMSPHMQPWADKMIHLINDESGETPFPVRVWAKGASRSVCGKWAQRGYRSIPWSGEPTDDWVFIETVMGGTGEPCTITGLCGQYWLSIADQPGEHEFPAVLAFIESHVRGRLNRVLAKCPAGSVVQCDTDGMLVSLDLLAAGFANVREQGRRSSHRIPPLLAAEMEFTRTAGPLTVRTKHIYDQVIVYGPQHMVMDGRPKLSGVPKSAWRVSESKWAARTWPGIGWQAEHGHPDGFVRPVQTYQVSGLLAHGWVTDSGRVVPVQLHTDGRGLTSVMPWDRTPASTSGVLLADVQPAWSRGLYDSAVAVALAVLGGQVVSVDAAGAA